jgi:hypothetical protein
MSRIDKYLRARHEHHEIRQQLKSDKFDLV